MINLGLIDILLVVVLLAVFVYASRRKEMLTFYVVLVLVLIIELERLVPGSLQTVGNAIRGIDTINASLPHISIQPIITIQR